MRGRQILPGHRPRATALALVVALASVMLAAGTTHADHARSPVTAHMIGPTWVFANDDRSFRVAVALLDVAPLGEQRTTLFVDHQPVASAVTGFDGEARYTLALANPGVRLVYADVHVAPGVVQRSDLLFVDVLPGLAPPEDVVATAGPLADEATLQWSAPSSTGPAPVTGYVIERRQAGGSDFADRATRSGGTRAFVDRVEPGVTYEYRVRSVSSVEISAPSDVATVAIPPWPPVDAFAFVEPAYEVCGTDNACQTAPAGGAVEYGWRGTPVVFPSLTIEASYEGVPQGGLPVTMRAAVDDGQVDPADVSQVLRTDAQGRAGAWRPPLAVTAPAFGACFEARLNANASYLDKASTVTSHTTDVCREPRPWLNVSFEVTYCSDIEGCVLVTPGRTVYASAGSQPTIRLDADGTLERRRGLLYDAGTPVEGEWVDWWLSGTAPRYCSACSDPFIVEFASASSQLSDANGEVHVASAWQLPKTVPMCADVWAEAHLRVRDVVATIVHIPYRSCRV